MELDLLKEMYSLQKESNERHSRIETKIEYMTDKIDELELHDDRQDEQIAKLAEILSDQKTLSHTVDTLAITVADNTKRIKAIEDKAGKVALSLWQKLLGGILGTGIASFALYVITTIKTLIKIAGGAE